jgi:dTDP-4-amino-4,6-dideoxygalactose transaminase
MSKLALNRKEKKPPLDSGDMFTSGSKMFKWPVVTQAMRDGVIKVLDESSMSGTAITREFERAFADWHGVKYAIGHNTGTASLHSAMYGTGLGVGDELICPSITYWASCLSALSLGAKIVFADIDPWTLCIDPDSIEHCITPRTKAIMVVHYLGYPADMDRIIPIAKKHDLKIIEDVSHAHGSRYHGRMTGTLGDVAGYSLMSAKSFAIGEAGIMLTNDQEIYERAILFGHYERQNELSIPELKTEAGLPLGGYKYRMHQMSSVVGLEMIKDFPAQMTEINKAMNYFWDQLDGLPGIRAHRPPEKSGSTMGAWYCPHGFFISEELKGLSIARFCEALRAEGINIVNPGCNLPLHKHRIFTHTDVYGSGQPTNSGLKHTELPVANAVAERTFYIPWFKKFVPSEIDRYVDIFKLVIENHKELLCNKSLKPKINASWALSPKKDTVSQKIEMVK